MHTCGRYWVAIGTGSKKWLLVISVPSPSMAGKVEQVVNLRTVVSGDLGCKAGVCGEVSDAAIPAGLPGIMTFSFLCLPNLPQV